jgi:hypothetical protein
MVFPVWPPALRRLCRLRKARIVDRDPDVSAECAAFVRLQVVIRIKYVVGVGKSAATDVELASDSEVVLLALNEGQSGGHRGAIRRDDDGVADAIADIGIQGSRSRAGNTPSSA